jgi:hypothetical protein
METIKYEIDVDNDYLASVKENIIRSGLEIVHSYSTPNFGTCLVLSGTLDEIKSWHEEQPYDFEFQEDFIVDDEE